METSEPVFIKTSLAVLRPWSVADADSIVKYADNPNVAGNLRDGFPSPYFRDDALKFISAANVLENGFMLAIETGGEACGGIGISILSDVYRKTAEIGYWIGEPFWGRGIVTEAVKAVVPVAFERFDIARIQAGVLGCNPASARVLEKCGFVREAVLKDAIFKKGRLMDEIMYARFRE
jgi:ribosomal-protein-alanine N-acetyltransferase